LHPLRPGGIQSKYEAQSLLIIFLIIIVILLVFDTTKEDLDRMLNCLASQIRILDATVQQRADFREIVTSQDNLRLVTLPNWAGLGAVQYISNEWLDQMEDLPEQGKKEMNLLNNNLVHQLKSADTAFSLGEQHKDKVKDILYYGSIKT
jgi:hypothetical protein